MDNLLIIMKGKPVILAVDDMALNLRTIKLILGDFYDVRLAKDGGLALSLLRSTRVDLILLDIEMPGISGFDFVREMNNNSYLNKAPVIFVTAHASPELLARAKVAGAVGYIIKPFTSEVLLQKVKAALDIKDA
ncbi:hypothetical protein AGMMS49928_11170 [Spirochaetia bacterium]|nr:hypothetical protein AGMMS49928_11170 [Spirochaetia bacterium]